MRPPNDEGLTHVKLAEPSFFLALPVGLAVEVEFVAGEREAGRG